MKSDELGREETIKRIGYRYRQALQANVEYFQLMKKGAEEDGPDARMARRYGMMPEAYGIAKRCITFLSVSLVLARFCMSRSLRQSFGL